MAREEAKDGHEVRGCSSTRGSHVAEVYAQVDVSAAGTEVCKKTSNNLLRAHAARWGKQRGGENGIYLRNRK